MKSFIQNFETFLRVRVYPINFLLSILAGLTFAQGIIQVLYGHRVRGFFLMLIPTLVFICEIAAIKLHYRHWAEELRKRQ